MPLEHVGFYESHTTLMGCKLWTPGNCKWSAWKRRKQQLQEIMTCQRLPVRLPQNLVAVQYCRKIWYRVVRPIAPGDELLLTHYGGSYSKILGTSAVGMREHVGLEATWQRKKKKNQTPAPPKTAPPNRMN